MRLEGGTNMKILLSPCFSDKKIEYEFNGQVITASVDGVTDTFDFTDMPDGHLWNVNTTLPINPILEAKKEDGELSVILLKYVGEDATERELFPDWQVIK